MALKMAVVVDYQNVHLTAVCLYMPGRPPEEALIDPYRFANQLAQDRRGRTVQSVDRAALLRPQWGRTFRMRTAFCCR